MSIAAFDMGPNLKTGKSAGSLAIMTVGTLMLVSTLYMVPVKPAHAHGATPTEKVQGQAERNEHLISVRYLA